MATYRLDQLSHLGKLAPPARAAAPSARHLVRLIAHAATAEPIQAETYLGEKFEKFPNAPDAPDAPLSGSGPEGGMPARSLRLKELDHVAVEVKNLPRMKKFYKEVIGCKELPRPAFPFGGAWLQAGSNLVIHLIQEDPSVPHKKPSNWEEHYETAQGHPEPWYIRRGFHKAFAVHDLEETEATLKEIGVRYDKFLVPGTNAAQLFMYDPEGNGIELGAGYDEIKRSVDL